MCHKSFRFVDRALWYKNWMESRIADELNSYSLWILIIILQDSSRWSNVKPCQAAGSKGIAWDSCSSKGTCWGGSPGAVQYLGSLSMETFKHILSKKTTGQNQTRNWSGTRLQYTGKKWYVEVERKGRVKKDEKGGKRGRPKPTEEEQSVTLCNFCSCKKDVWNEKTCAMFVVT